MYDLNEERLAYLKARGKVILMLVPEVEKRQP